MSADVFGGRIKYRSPSIILVVIVGRILHSIVQVESTTKRRIELEIDDDEDESALPADKKVCLRLEISAMKRGLLIVSPKRI